VAARGRPPARVGRGRCTRPHFHLHWVKCGQVQRSWLGCAGGWLWAVAGSGPSVPPSTARLLARDHNRLHMETQPRHAAAQVTLLEASFVFLPCRRQVPLVWGENSSSEQHSFGKLPMLLPLGARNESSSEHNRASSSEHNRASSSGAACSSSGMQRQQRAASAERQDQGAEQVPSASRSSSSGELQAAAAASGERRAAAATESSLVQARKSGLTKANIDPQPPSTVVLQARAQLRKRSVQDVGNTNARATGSHLLWLCSRPVSTAAE